MLELRKDIFADERDDNLKEIGRGTQRQDMLGHVTGTSTYFDDHKLQGMLHLKVLRSAHAHARLRIQLLRKCQCAARGQSPCLAPTER